MLASVETDALAGVHGSVVGWSLWDDAVEIEVLVRPTLEAGSAELEHQFKPSFPCPLFLTLSHGYLKRFAQCVLPPDLRL